MARPDAYRLPDGTVVPSVTEVLDLLSNPHLARLANRMGMEHRDISVEWDYYAAIGTLVHHRVARAFGAQEPPVALEVWQAIDAAGEGRDDAARKAIAAADRLLAWASDMQLQPIAVECPVVHPAGYGGTLDLVAACPSLGGVCVIDWKTSSAVRQRHRIQAQAYRNAWDATVSDPRLRADTALVVGTAREGSEVWVSEVKGRKAARYSVAFGGLLAVYQALHNPDFSEVQHA